VEREIRRRARRETGGVEIVGGGKGDKEKAPKKTGGVEIV
jgi:hypothetical protein